MFLSVPFVVLMVDSVKGEYCTTDNHSGIVMAFLLEWKALFLMLLIIKESTLIFSSQVLLILFPTLARWYFSLKKQDYIITS